MSLAAVTLYALTLPLESLGSGGSLNLILPCFNQFNIFTADKSLGFYKTLVNYYQFTQNTHLTELLLNNTCNLVCDLYSVITYSTYPVYLPVQEAFIEKHFIRYKNHYV